MALTSGYVGSGKAKTLVVYKLLYAKQKPNKNTEYCAKCCVECVPSTGWGTYFNELVT